MMVLTALLFPAAGAFRGILGILSWAMFGNTDLEKAARAGALCMVVRGPDWEPHEGDTLQSCILYQPAEFEERTNGSEPSVCQEQKNPIRKEEKKEPASPVIRVVVYDPPWSSPEVMYGDDLRRTKLRIQGSFLLPPGYRVVLVPRDASFLESSDRPRTTLMYNYSFVKILVSLGQAIYAIFTLYRARGDQIAQFGYAAFGLTVAPYAVVSILNLFGSFICPEFSALYMVDSTTMEESRNRGAMFSFDGVVGKLHEEVIHTEPVANQVDTHQPIKWIPEPLTFLIEKGGLAVKGTTQMELSRVQMAKVESCDFEDAPFPFNMLLSAYKSYAKSMEDPHSTVIVAASDPQQGLSRISRWIAGSIPRAVKRLSDETQQNIILVPYMNPIKRKHSKWSADTH
jgi:hypothetical protein